jgi:hypothetical protein
MAVSVVLSSFAAGVLAFSAVFIAALVHGRVGILLGGVVGTLMALSTQYPLVFCALQAGTVAFCAVSIAALVYGRIGILLGGLVAVLMALLTECPSFAPLPDTSAGFMSSFSSVTASGA